MSLLVPIKFADSLKKNRLSGYTGRPTASTVFHIFPFFRTLRTRRGGQFFAILCKVFCGRPPIIQYAAYCLISRYDCRELQSYLDSITSVNCPLQGTLFDIIYTDIGGLKMMKKVMGNKLNILK